MLKKITYAGAILAAAALASEELEMDHDEARLLADQFSKDPSFGEHARLLSSEFASEGASDEERELHWTGPYGLGSRHGGTGAGLTIEWATVVRGTAQKTGLP